MLIFKKLSIPCVYTLPSQNVLGKCANFFPWDSFCSSQHLREHSPLSLASPNWRDGQGELVRAQAVIFLQTAAGLLSDVGQTPNCTKRKRILTCSSTNSNIICALQTPFLCGTELTWTFRDFKKHWHQKRWLVATWYLCSKVPMLLISQLYIC